MVKAIIVTKQVVQSMGLESYFSRQGHNAVVAPDTENCLSELRKAAGESEPVIVLLDHDHIGSSLDGVAVLKAIEAEGFSPHVILISSSVVEFAEFLKDAGAYANRTEKIHLPKGLEIDRKAGEVLEIVAEMGSDIKDRPERGTQR